VISAECPLCGVHLVVPAGGAATLQCRKCHTTFHLDRSGRSVVGNPPDVGQEVERKIQEIRQTLDPRRALERVQKGRAVAIVATLLVLGLGGYVLFGPSRSLSEAAERAARAFADDDRSSLRAMAASGTAEDVDRWAAELYPRYVRERDRWPAKPVFEVQGVTEVGDHRKGSAEVSIHPGVASGLDVSLANSEAATASAPTPLILRTAWTRDWRGRWRLDGRETYAKANGSH